MRWLHLHALSVLAIAQPLFDQFGRNPTFFVAHRASTTTIWLLTGTLFLLPGLVLAVCSLGIAAVNRRLGWIVHCTLLGVLAAMVVLPTINRNFGQRTVVSLVVALLIAAVVAAFYNAKERARPFFTYLSMFTVVILGLFVFGSGVSDLLFERGVEASGAAGNDTSVVMLVFDELPVASLLDAETNLDPTRAPNLAEFAGDATWYANTTTVSARTQWAVPAILTGQQADLSTSPTAAQHPQNLFTSTASSHDLLVAETVTRLCPEEVCAERAIAEGSSTGNILSDTRVLYFHTLLPIGLADRWLPPINTGWTGFDTDQVAEPVDDDDTGWIVGDLNQDQRSRFESFIAQLADNNGPTVSYAHVLLPHAPWQYLPDGTLYNGDRIPGLSAGNELWTDNEALLDQATHRYLLQLGYVDVLLGQVMRQLQQTGQYDDAMIIVTADHGTSFVPATSRREAQATTVADVAMVPLFVKYPGQNSAERVDLVAQTIDIFPTIADVLELDLEDPTDGESLRTTNRSRSTRSLNALTPIDDLDAQLDLAQAIDRITQVVPTGVPAADIWGSRSTREWVGSDVVDLDPVAGPAPFEVEEPNGATYRNIDRQARFLPMRFLATVVGGEAADGTSILVALNGTIAGGNETVDNKVSVLLDPERFVDGQNTVEVFTVQDGGLVPVVNREAIAFEIDAGGDKVTRVVQGERSWDTPNPGDLLGFAAIPEPRQPGRTPPIRGWAASTDTGESAEYILIVADGTVMLSQAERTNRPDVVDATGDERLLDSGWSFDLTPAQFDTEPFAIALFPNGSFHVMTVNPQDGE